LRSRPNHANRIPAHLFSRQASICGPLVRRVRDDASNRVVAPAGAPKSTPQELARRETMASAIPFDLPVRAAARPLVLLTMCLGILVAQVDTSVVNLALTHINADLGADVGELQWVVDAYNLTYATLLLTGGVLGDLYGRRRLFALGIALFTLGSLVCGL